MSYIHYNMQPMYVCMHLAPLVQAHANTQLNINNLKCAAMCGCVCCVHACASYMCFSMSLELSHAQLGQTCVAKQALLFKQCDMICMHCACRLACTERALPTMQCSEALPVTINSPWNFPDNSVDAIITKFYHVLTLNRLLLGI